ncbi:hypothetical protein L1049_007853 [Liquidambar formosana]|uniref:Uncharacterized protein n=1 Tax=Liquidambar formosana TaxID=63359 RepID=A0AAP0S2K3_LIQFO
MYEEVLYTVPVGGSDSTKAKGGIGLAKKFIASRTLQKCHLELVSALSIVREPVDDPEIRVQGTGGYLYDHITGGRSMQ